MGAGLTTYIYIYMYIYIHAMCIMVYLHIYIHIYLHIYHIRYIYYFYIRFCKTTGLISAFKNTYFYVRVLFLCGCQVGRGEISGWFYLSQSTPPTKLFLYQQISGFPTGFVKISRQPATLRGGHGLRRQGRPPPRCLGRPLWVNGRRPGPLVLLI